MTPRRATPEDIPAMARIVCAWEQTTPWLDDAATPAPGVLAGYIAQAFPAREIWVIGEPVAGYASLDPETSKLGALYTTRTGQGLGKALLNRVKAGRDFVWLTTHGPNTRAQAFYRREGFMAVADLPGEAPHQAVPLIRMEWRA